MSQVAFYDYDVASCYRLQYRVYIHQENYTQQSQITYQNISLQEIKYLSYSRGSSLMIRNYSSSLIVDINSCKSAAAIAKLGLKLL